MALEVDEEAETFIEAPKCNGLANSTFLSPIEIKAIIPNIYRRSSVELVEPEIVGKVL
ncbi:MAG: hypothetical protein ACREMY_07505 [bacterium]